MYFFGTGFNTGIEFGVPPGIGYRGQGGLLSLVGAFGRYSRVRNKHNPTLIIFFGFFPGATALFWTPSSLFTVKSRVTVTF